MPDVEQHSFPGMAPARRPRVKKPKKRMLPKFDVKVEADGKLVHSLGWHYPDLHDFEFRLTIYGTPAVAKNRQSARLAPAPEDHDPHKGPRCPKCKDTMTCSCCGTDVMLIVTKSSQAATWERRAIKQLRPLWATFFEGPLPTGLKLNAAIVTYTGKGKKGQPQKPDPVNLYDGPQDALQKAGVISNDYWIRSHNRSGCRRDDAKPRVEITLTPYREDEVMPSHEREDLEF